MLKIGVFDSGLGGLTVVEVLTQIIQNATIYYIADTKNAPYGEKTAQQILGYSLDITQYFIDTYDVDVLIIACNTATSYAIEQIRHLYPQLIILGSEPAIKPAIAQTSSGKIGVLATPATLQGKKYQTLLRRLCLEKSIAIYEQPCHGLVQEIEKGQRQNPTVDRLLKQWLEPMYQEGVDTIVLGCTHYPLVSEEIKKNMHYRVRLIDTAKAISNHLLTLATQKNHLNQGSLFLHLYTTGNIEKRVIKAIFKREIPITLINIKSER